MSPQVAVDKEGPQLSFHHPDQIPSLIGMELISREEARERGAVMCSQCYERNNTMYDFSYTEGGLV